MEKEYPKISKGKKTFDPLHLFADIKQWTYWIRESRKGLKKLIGEKR